MKVCSNKTESICVNCVLPEGQLLFGDDETKLRLDMCRGGTVNISKQKVLNIDLGEEEIMMNMQKVGVMEENAWEGWDVAR